MRSITGKSGFDVEWSAICIVEPACMYDTHIRETTGCLALDFSDFDTSALGFGGFVFF